MIFILTRPILDGVRIIIEELIEVLITWKLSSAMKSFTQQLAPLEFSWGLVSQLNLNPSINSFVPEKNIFMYEPSKLDGKTANC